jgi:hypothetical protein
MEKDCIICFETTLEIETSLQRIADEERLNVSLVVESIVNNYLKENKEFKGSYLEQRRFERQKVDIQAFIGHSDWPRRDFKECKILDISMSGIRLSIPRETGFRIQEDAKDTTFSIIFTLPKNLWAINVKFQPRRIYEAEAEIQVGAIFVKPTFHTFTALSNYLM